MEFESPWHMFIYYSGQAWMIYASMHVPIWCMKGGRWASLWISEKP